MLFSYLIKLTVTPWYYLIARAYSGLPDCLQISFSEMVWSHQDSKSTDHIWSFCLSCLFWSRLVPPSSLSPRIFFVCVSWTSYRNQVSCPVEFLTFGICLLLHSVSYSVPFISYKWKLAQETWLKHLNFWQEYSGGA